MPFNLFLLPLLGGFIFIRLFSLTRFSTSRLSGQRLIIWAALMGVFCVIVARMAVLILQTYFPVMGYAWQNFVPFQYSGTSFGAFLIGCLAWLPLNVCISKRWAIRWTINRYGSEAEKLFARSLEHNKQVQLTLTDSKVYVGYIVWNPPEPHDDCSYIGILPTSSGYRHPETREVEFTTSYVHIYEALNSGDKDVNERLDSDDFRKYFPLDQISVVSIFDPDVKLLFNDD